MTLAAALVLGLSLSAPARAPAVKLGPPPAPPPSCVRYRAQAERNELLPEGEVAAWATAALERAALLDPASPCFVHVRITAGPISTMGRQDGFVAHVSASTRRFFRDGKLVTREKGLLVVQAHREDVIPRIHEFVDEFVAGIVTTAPTTPAAAAPPPAAPPAGAPRTPAAAPGPPPTRSPAPAPRP